MKSKPLAHQTRRHQDRSTGVLFSVDGHRAIHALALIVVGFGLAATGCSSPGNGTAVPLLEEAEMPTDTEAVDALWVDFVTASATGSTQEQLAGFAADNAIRAADTAFFEPRLPQSFYTQVIVDGETATIEDCSLFSFPLVDFPYIPMTGEASKIGDSWQITGIEVRAADRCLPGDLAAEVLRAYEDFWDNELAFSNPPDPNHQLIGRTLTGRRLQRKRAVLEWQVENNAELRGRPVTDPWITDFRPGVIVLADCQTPDPETGFYDMTSGERRPENPPIEPGQTDMIRTWLELEGNLWKVEFSAIESNAGCEVGDADGGIPIVGPIEGP